MGDIFLSILFCIVASAVALIIYDCLYNDGDDLKDLFEILKDLFEWLMDWIKSKKQKTKELYKEFFEYEPLKFKEEKHSKHL